MDMTAAYSAVRLVPRLANVGMLVVIVLQLTRLISPAVGLVDVVALLIVGIASKRLIQSGKIKPPE